MIKKIMTILSISVFLLLFSACSEEPVAAPQNLSCGSYSHGATWDKDCNTCSCNNGTITCTEIDCTPKNDTSFVQEFQDTLNYLKFNSNLTDYEEEWLEYFEAEYPNSKIYHIKTTTYSCDGCYELYYKKDREILKVKVLDNKKVMENVITDDIVVEIENEDVCKLFSGTWNTCPQLCTTDEEACITGCGLPTCEFDENKITLKNLNEECGDDKGDCKYGLTCYYNTNDDKYGTCKYS